MSIVDEAPRPPPLWRVTVNNLRTMMAKEPAWLLIARDKVGMRELPGPTHNSKLLAFLNTATKFNGLTWKDDEMPWCGGFVAACLLSAGVEPVRIAARAKSWAAFGANLRTTHLAPGAILVFGRDGGGHVGFYVGEDDHAYHVLGGNQSNCVCVTRIVKSRLIAARWPRGVPVTGGPVRMEAIAGVPLSRNEA